MARHDEEFPALPSLREEVEQFFSQVLGGRPARPFAGELWSPQADLFEEEDRFVLMMDLPGVREEDLRIELEGPVLTVSGRREFVRERGGPRARLRERYSGSFRRTVALPAAGDPGRVTAFLRDGVLRVEVAKREGRR